METLQAASIAVAVVNPRRVRDFAKGIGIDAKTDPIDAKLIARYGEVVQLPELGELNRGQIAKLLGVAPINHDSGKHQGKRKTIAGRSSVRRVLYMATLVATRHNARIKPFYQRLLAGGKPKKLAPVAAMRKPLTIINMLIKRDQLWSEPKPT